MGSNTLGVVIVTYDSADVILGCLESVMASHGVDLRVIVVDNASTDDTVERIRMWGRGNGGDPLEGVSLPVEIPRLAKPVPVGEIIAPNSVTLIENGDNVGFAGGVNRGLAMLLAEPEVSRFWILNPDCVVAPGTAKAFAEHQIVNEHFALMGGRIIYAYQPYDIQIDGGTVNWMTGTTGNLGKDHPSASTPPPNVQEIDFVSGASMVASRQFVEKAGLLPEDYFLYYEEADWALRRGNLPLVYCANAIVYHHAGSAIGSPTRDKMASPLSLYFKIRGRRMFLQRHSPWSLPASYIYGLMKLIHTLAKGYPEQAMALLCALHGFGPPAGVRARLSNAALKRLT